MNNLQIGDNDLIGNRFNGHDLHLYLREKGIISNHLVWKKNSNDPYTYELATTSEDEILNDKFLNLETRFSTQSILYHNSYQLLRNKLFLESDIVHYHLIHNNFFSLSHFPILSYLKPSVWTLHDPWALTGHCIYPFECERWKIGCGDCPSLNTHFSINDDLTALNWEIKKLFYKISNMDIILASNWMYNLVKDSPLFESCDLHVIPFGLNLDLFKPGNNIEAKKSLGISTNSIVLCFRAINSQFKGLSHIKNVLHKLKTNYSITLLTFNEKDLMNEFKGKFKVIDLGWVNDEKYLVNAYNAADIFLMPSTAEAFGMMAMEAMACEKTVIVFKGTALENTVFSPEGGIAIDKGNEELFLKELVNLIENKEKRRIIGSNALKLTKENYDSKQYVNKIIELYREIITKRKPDNRKKYIINQLEKTAFDYKKEKEKSNKNLIKNEIDLFILLKNISQIKIIRFFAFKVILPLLKGLSKIYILLKK